MFRINYRPPELLPPHQRDFPPKKLLEERSSGDDGSWQLALMVGLYLVAMCAGLALLGLFTSPTEVNTVTAHILAGR
jgi:hypothetical protein